MKKIIVGGMVVITLVFFGLAVVTFMAKLFILSAIIALLGIITIFITIFASKIGND